jgi:hypothetical protein
MFWLNPLKEIFCKNLKEPGEALYFKLIKVPFYK